MSEESNKHPFKFKKFLEKRSKKAGLSPGTMVHIGEESKAKPKISLIDYTQEEIQELETFQVEETVDFRDKDSVTWINIDGIHRLDIVEKLGKNYGIHPLVLEDIVNTDQRPKVEEFASYLYIVVRVLDYSEKYSQVESEQVSIILGKNFVLSFQEETGDIFEPLRKRLRQKKSAALKNGPDYLMYSLLDAIVDHYFVILEKLEEDLEELEEEVLQDPEVNTLRELHNLKREIILLRKSIYPLREVIRRLQKGEFRLISSSTEIYLRDVYDHAIQVLDIIETFREILSSMFDIYLSSVNNKMNETMKVLTVIATIFIPLTFIAGIYGMNFKYMPELNWRWGYPAIWAIMITIGTTMLYFFKRKDWL